MGPQRAPAISDPAAAARVHNLLSGLPLAFEPNRGQAGDGVAFVCRGRGYSISLTPIGILAQFRRPGTGRAFAGRLPQLGGMPDHDRFVQPRDAEPVPAARLFIKFVGANPRSRAEGIVPLPGRSNYFLGNDPSKWVSDVPHFEKVRFSEVYPGTDLVYYGNQGRLEFDLVLKPGSDPKAIQLQVSGQAHARLGADGDLILQTEAGDVRLASPLVYQESGGRRQRIEARYARTAENRFAFRVGAHDPSRALVIDPVLVYSTYLGGSYGDQGNVVAVDSGGSAYVTGTTESTNFPTMNPLQTTMAGWYDVFVTKLNSAGASLTYSTYLGGSSIEGSHGIAVDSGGNAFVAGWTYSTDFPTMNPFQSSNAGGYDAFVAKLNSAGTALAYSTYLGGGSTDQGYSLALDSGGSAHVTGATNSANFPTMNPLQALNGVSDAFVTKLDAAGTSLVFSTYLGGSSGEDGRGIAVDSGGSAYVTGLTASTNFPTMSPLQGSHGGGIWDTFVSKLDSTGSTLVYSTYLGGSLEDWGRGIAVDSAGSCYITGRTDSVNFPTMSPLQGSNAGGLYDAFVTKLNAAGSALVYSTYLGGSSGENTNNTAGRISVDSGGYAYVTGNTDSTNFPTMNPIQASNAGNFDAFVTKLNAAGTTLAYSTYLGGTSADAGKGIAVDSGGSAYVTGDSLSTNFPTMNPIQASYGGGVTDAFVSKISDVAGSPTATTTTCPTSMTSATSTQTPSPTPTASGTASHSPTSSRSASVTTCATATSAPSDSATQTQTISGTDTSTETPSPSPTASGTESGTPSVTGSATATSAPSDSATGTPTVSGTSSPTNTQPATATATATISATSTPSASRSPSSSRTSSRTATPSASSSQTASGTASLTATRTGTRTGTASASDTPAQTPTACATPTSSATQAPIATATATATPSRTATPPAGAPYIRLDRNAMRAGAEPLEVEFALAEEAEASVAVFNSAGEFVSQVWSGRAPALTAVRARWRGTNDEGAAVSGNVYVVRVTAGQLLLTAKVAVLH